MENTTSLGEIQCPDSIWSNYTHNFIYVYKARVPGMVYSRMALSLTGCILNLAIFVIFYAKKLDSRFEKCLRDYSLASFIILIIYFTTAFFNFNYYTTVGFYLRVFVYSTLYITLSFTRILDTYIIYERIQLYKPDLKFLSKLKFAKLSAIFLTIAILSNFNEIIMLMHRFAFKISKNCKATKIILSYLFLEKTAFKIFGYIIITSKFLLNFVIVLVLNLYLLKVVKTFHRYKTCLKISATSDLRNKTRERNNTVIALVLCFISTCLSFVSFFDSFFDMNLGIDKNKFFELIYILIDFFIMLKFSVNFFLFYFLNRKFKKCINKLFVSFASLYNILKESVM